MFFFFFTFLRKINEYLEAKFKKEMELQDVTRKKEEHKLRFYDSVVKTLKESEVHFLGLLVF